MFYVYFVYLVVVTSTASFVPSKFGKKKKFQKEYRNECVLPETNQIIPAGDGCMEIFEV